MSTLGAARERQPARWQRANANRFVTADGAAIHVREDGPADAAVTLVLVHGWTQDHRTWDPVFSRLDTSAGSYRVLRHDLRGHGASGPATARTATIEQLADDLAELIAARAPEGPLVLAGHSMGGMTIMALLARHPELVSRRVHGVAFVATSSGHMDRITLGLPGRAGSAAARTERVLARRLSRLRRSHLPLSPALARQGARALVFGKRPGNADVAAVAEQLLCANPANLGQFQNAISTHERGDALTALRGTPVAVFVGDRDRLCPESHALAIVAALPHAVLFRYPGAGHMLPQERAADVATGIADLLRHTVAGS